MSVRGLFDRTTLPQLARFLDLSALRQRAHASNIANTGIAGYKRVEAKFADELAQSKARLTPRATHPQHAGGPGQGAGAPTIAAAPGPNGDFKVDLDRESVALAENQLRFSFGTRLAVLRIAGLRASIHGRR